MKKVPEYWWDFGEGNEIIVESDDDRFPVVGRFSYPCDRLFGAAEHAIEKAEELIKDLEEGHKTPTSV